MRLTVKQLNATMQERFDMMTQQIKRSDDDRYELHNRCDRILLNLDRFKKSTAADFREVRAEISSLRSEVSELRSEVSELRSEVSELRSEISELRKEVAEFRAELRELRSFLVFYVEQTNDRLTKLENRC
jgi:chromosome segregation ATPase